MNLETPNITQIQAVALVAAAIDLLVQFGVDLTDGQQTALLAFFGVLASVVLADAHIRGKRADAVAVMDWTAGGTKSDKAA